MVDLYFGVYLGRIKLRSVPTMMVSVIIIATDLSISLSPSSLASVVNVATHGKYIASITEAMISCRRVNPSGTSIPTATSLRRNPISKAPTVSLGNPNNPVTIGAASLPISWIIPSVYSTLTMKTPSYTNGTASLRNHLTRIHTFLATAFM